MSVIYKALSTIEAAEGVRHGWPGAAELAAARHREGRHGSRLLLIVAVLSGLCVIMIVVASEQPSIPGVGGLAGITGVAFGRTATAAASGGNRGAADRRSQRSLAAPVAGSTAAPQPVRYVFEPSNRSQGGRSGAAHLSFPAADFAAADTESNANRFRHAVRKAPFAASLADTTVSRPAASSAQRSTKRGLVTVTADHTQRIRLLNVALSRAVAQDDKHQVDHLLAQLQAVVGDDSSYILKVRAFTRLALGGDDEYAIGLLRQVLARDPDDREAAVNLAVAQINLGRIAEARQRLRALASVYPGDSQVDQLLRLVR